MELIPGGPILLSIELMTFIPYTRNKLILRKERILILMDKK